MIFLVGLYGMAAGALVCLIAIPFAALAGYSPPDWGTAGLIYGCVSAVCALAALWVLDSW